MSIFHEMTLILTQWPWYSTWPRYCQDVSPHQKWSFYVNWFKSYSPNRQTHTHTQTDTHTHTHTHTFENITCTAYAGGNNGQTENLFLSPPSPITPMSFWKTLRILKIKANYKIMLSWWTIGKFMTIEFGAETNAIISCVVANRPVFSTLKRRNTLEQWKFVLSYRRKQWCLLSSNW